MGEVDIQNNVIYCGVICDGDDRTWAETYVNCKIVLLMGGMRVNIAVVLRIDDMRKILVNWDRCFTDDEMDEDEYIMQPVIAWLVANIGVYNKNGLGEFDGDGWSVYTDYKSGYTYVYFFEYNGKEIDERLVLEFILRFV